MSELLILALCSTLCMLEVYVCILFLLRYIKQHAGITVDVPCLISHRSFLQRYTSLFVVHMPLTGMEMAHSVYQLSESRVITGEM